MKLYDLFENNVDEDDGIRDTRSPLPMAQSSLIASLSDAASYIYSKADGDWETLKKMGSIKPISVAKIIGSEEYLDGQHLDAFVNGKRTASELPLIILFSGRRYVLVDGNHKVAAAKIRGDENIKSLVFDIKNL